MKKYFLLSLVCLGSWQVFGQLKQFDLKTYKQPELNRFQLDFNLSQNNNSSVPSNDSYEELEGIKKKSSFSFNGQGVFSWYRNSANYQGQTRSTLSFHPHTEKVKFENNDRDDTKFKRNQLSFSLNSENFFYDSNNWFIAPEIDLDYSSNKLDGESLSGNSTNEYDNSWHNYDNIKRVGANIKASFSAGKGRIERVEDARQVLHILDALNEDGRLKRIPSNEEIIQIAQRVSEVKNERFFDFRHKQMYEIREMDAILKEMDLINEDDALYYTNLYDMWQHGANEERLAGERFSIGLSPLYNRFDSESDGHYHYEGIQKYLAIIGFIRFEYENPINQKWQSSIFSEISYGSIKGETESSSDDSQNNNFHNNTFTSEINCNNINADLGYTIGFYPNTRTYASANAMLTYKTFNGEIEEDIYSNDFDYKDIQGQLKIELHYYISPQVRLKCTTGTLYSSTESQELPYYINNLGYSPNKWTNYFELNLRFSVF